MQEKTQVKDRIRLVRTDDPYTQLKPGDTGTVIDYMPASGAISVRWDSGSTLSLLEGIDVWEIIGVRVIVPAPEADQ